LRVEHPLGIGTRVHAGKSCMRQKESSACKFLELTSEPARIHHGKRMFLYAFLITLACWIVAESIVPFLFDYGPSDPRHIIYQIIINLISST
jgi:hypothetical protein